MQNQIINPGVFLMFNDWWNEIIFDDKKINLPDVIL